VSRIIEISPWEQFERYVNVKCWPPAPSLAPSEEPICSSPACSPACMCIVYHKLATVLFNGVAYRKRCPERRTIQTF
jgi:hypothetical protein